MNAFQRHDRKLTEMEQEHQAMKETNDQIKLAYRQGFSAVSSRPYHAPRNPYDEDENPDLYQAWDEGADDAGINSMYYNGELKP